MAFLDCETLQTTYSSVCEILGITKEQLQDFFQMLDLESDKEFSSKYHGDIETWILGRLKEQVNYQSNLDGIYWFHLSRTIPNTTFQEGILPLGSIINQLWDFLHSLVASETNEEQWKNFRKKVETTHEDHSAHLYRLKVPNSNQWGPFAILVREIGFNPSEIGNHDYFRVPEIIEDICIAFEIDFGIDLLARFYPTTKPCVVKFTGNKVKMDYVGTALYYLYCRYHKHELSIYCNDCYDGRGKKVEAGNIVKVEFVDYQVTI